MSIFKFKYFQVQQGKSAMKIGTDSFLLGAFFPEKQTGNALDIGTGTGVLSLILAQKNPDLAITAIEIDEDAAKEAELNFLNSPFLNPFQLIHTDFLNYPFENQFDLIVSNPPFFVDGTRSNSSQRDLARNSNTLPFNSLVQKVVTLLSENASFWLILPAEGFSNFEAICLKNELFLNIKISIFGKENQLNRIIACFSNKEKPVECNSLIVRNSDNSYSDSYRILTKDLHFYEI